MSWVWNMFAHHSYTDSYQHQPPDFNNRKSGWVCAAFNIDSEDIKSKDFYILTDPELDDNSDFHCLLDIGLSQTSKY